MTRKLLDILCDTWHRVISADEALEEIEAMETPIPKRKPLTDEEIFDCENNVPDAVVSDRDWCIYFARAIEAAHGIKGDA